MWSQGCADVRGAVAINNSSDLPLEWQHVLPNIVFAIHRPSKPIESYRPSHI